jgi:hypothetical protein
VKYESKMATPDFSLTIITKKTSQEVVQTILNVRDWWSGIYSEAFEGEAAKLNDEFSFRTGNGAHYSKQKLVELIPNNRVVWLITESELSFLEKTDEWTGTKLVFEISKEGNNTRVIFTHQGLTPEIECYDSCAPAWRQYIQYKLQPLLNTGKVQ